MMKWLVTFAHFLDHISSLMHKNDIKARRIYATCHGVGDPLKACPSPNVIPRPSLPFSVKRYGHK